jgi:hypothetical protein
VLHRIAPVNCRLKRAKHRMPVELITQLC